jgi:hypothetical protein
MLDAREPVEPGQLGGQVGARHRLAFTSDGEMFIDPEPIPDGLAVNWLTGEDIDVSGMVEVGRLVPTYGGDNVRTDCSPICAIYYQPGQEGVRAPTDGTLQCIDEDGDRTFAFDSDKLHLRLRGFGGASFSASCEERQVAAGDRLPTATYTMVKAVDADGLPLSLVATRDGRLFVGVIELQFGCPCDGRS